MARQAENGWGAWIKALGLLGLVDAMPVAALDVSGVYVSQVTFVLPAPCTLTFTQTGTALTITGPCDFVGTIYTFDLAGTVDTATGALSLSGRLLGLCEDPGEFTMTGSGDGEVFSGTVTCGSVSSPATGTKCGNGVVDATEDCEDGNTAAGDCCSPVCRFDPVDAACTADGTACTQDVCDGAGHCLHPLASSGTPCETDFNVCTDDACDAGGACAHVPNAGPCDDLNACTTADTCADGDCVGGPIAAACVGPVDLTGDWVLLPGDAFFTPSPVRHFEQNGAVLESRLGSGVGVGSVNPATGEFRSLIPYTVLFAQCMEIVEATATLDSQSFSGMRSFACGLDGFFGPYPVSGERCTSPVACACATGAPCTRPDGRTRLLVRSEGGSLPTRWQWVVSTPTTFGNPTLNANYQICVETADGGFTELAPHGSDWRATRTGFRYRQAAGPIRTLVLKSTAKKTVLTASLVPASTPALPFTSPVRVRLLQTNGTQACFEAEFADPIVNTATRYLAAE